MYSRTYERAELETIRLRIFTITLSMDKSNGIKFSSHDGRGQKCTQLQQMY